MTDANKDSELREQVHKRLVEISSSYGGYIGGRQNRLWPAMFKQIEDYFTSTLNQACLEARIDTAQFAQVWRETR